MPINLTVAQTLTNGSRLVLDKRRMLEDEKVFTCNVQMRTAVNGTPGDAIISEAGIEIRAPQPDPLGGTIPGFGSSVTRKVLATGERLGGILTHNPNVAVSDAQWAALVTAYKANLATLEAHLLSAGYIHSSLAGT